MDLYSGDEVEAVEVLSLSLELFACCCCSLLLVAVLLSIFSTLSKRGLNFPRLLLTALCKSCKLGTASEGRRPANGSGKGEAFAVACFVFSSSALGLELAWLGFSADSSCPSSSSSSASMYLKSM